MWAVDTNILLYSADRCSPFHEVCRSSLERWRVGPAPMFLTWGVCYEFLRVATHPKVFPRPWSMPAALEFVSTLQRSRGVQMLTPTDRHTAVLAQTVAEIPALQGNDAHDLHTAVLMREHGISRICTRDAGFRRFAFLTPFDPTVVSPSGSPP